MDQFDVDAPLIQAYDSKHAAAYLGVSLNRLNQLRQRGLVESFSTADRGPNNGRGGADNKWRFPLESLRRFRALRAGPKKKWWDPNKEDLPIITVARLMGLSKYVVLGARARNALKSLSPVDVREYMLQYYADKIGKDLRKYYAEKLQKEKVRNKELTSRLVTHKCQTCQRKLAQHRFHRANKRFMDPPKLDVAKELSQLLTRTSADTSESVTESQ